MADDLLSRASDSWKPPTDLAVEPGAQQSPRGLDDWRPAQGRAANSGLNPAQINMLMWAGGALVALGVVVVGILIVTGMSGPSSPRDFHLGPGKSSPTYVKFEKGIKVQVWVSSEHDSDVDLFVFDRTGRLVVRDEDDSRNCFVSFTPKETQTFKLLVVNRIRLEHHLMERNRDNQCRLKWEQGKPARS
jgi:hypothetical protein